MEEERERRLESLFEEGLEDTNERRNAADALPDAPPDEGTVGLAGRRTMATLGAAESIVDALEMAAAEVTRRAEHEAEAAKVRLHACLLPVCARARGKASDARLMKPK